MRSNVGEPLKHAALPGHGISMHPAYMVVQDIKENRLQVVRPTCLPIGLDLYAMYPSRRNMPGRVRLFLEFHTEQFHKTAEWQTEVKIKPDGDK